ncbi:MAG: hypothetical protein ACYDB7_13200 [Mycobacteriales bacterium]
MRHRLCTVVLGLLAAGVLLAPGAAAMTGTPQHAGVTPVHASAGVLPSFDCGSGVESQVCAVVFGPLCRHGCYINAAGARSTPLVARPTGKLAGAQPSYVCSITADLAYYLYCVSSECSGHICRD